MNEQRRGTAVRAITALRHPSEPITVLPRMEGVILHEIEETETSRHRLFIRWEHGGIFYAFAEEVVVIDE